MDELKRIGVSSVLGDGTQTRDMIFVGDVVDSIVLAMLAEGPLKGTFLPLPWSLCISVFVLLPPLSRLPLPLLLLLSLLPLTLIIR
jgi:hypothetical protein